MTPIDQPTAAVPTVSPTASTGLQSYLHWFKAHERILILAGCALLAYHFYNAGLTAWINHDKAQSDIAAQKVTADATASKMLLDELSQLRAQVQQQSIQLNAAMTQRAVQTQTQKTANDKLDTTQLALHIAQLLKVTPQQVTPSPVTGDVTFTAGAAHANVNALEDLKQVQSDIIDLKTELTGDEQVIMKQSAVITQDAVSLSDEKVSHADDIKTLKAENKTKWLSGFKWGFIAGAVSGEVLRVFVTHKP